MVLLHVMDLSVTTEQDRRYRVLLVLERSDRPTNWKPYCIRCQMPIKMELINADIVSITDMIDMDTTPSVVGVRCDGRYNGKHCNFWYYAKLVPNG